MSGNTSKSINPPPPTFSSGPFARNVGTTMGLILYSPMMSYNSATGDIDRLAKAKNLTMFYEELANGTLPQWMWITPNMSKSKT